MDAWPEFVKEEETSGRPRVIAEANLTGWETVVFRVEDQEPDSSTAALAP